ncbi:hypothetical protein ACFB49_48180 [Sphingomonas sp. DBB INV C78]|uniref:DUF1624 domain-containing protein n=1 Tax=Sphingomonas sp. DBB INV C78 TaxID=3349434 RepID=UPI0036D3C965
MDQVAGSATVVPSGALTAGARLRSIDILRGLVIVIMALDHVRDYLHISGYALDPLDPEQSWGLLYATRWITHFCAPTFVFLSGLSAWLQHVKGKPTPILSRFLLLRGLWLLLLEVTVMSFGWAFSVPWLLFLQVIWAIGWSMIALAALVWLPRIAVLAIGIAIIAGHNLFDGVDPAALGAWGPLWQFLQTGGIWPPSAVPPEGVIAFQAYPVLAWIGVMAFGYGIGAVFLSPARDRILPFIGLGMIGLFLLLRLTSAYGDPQPWTVHADFGATLMDFLDVRKYPPSLLYVCATIGPVLMLVPLIERWRGVVAEFFRTFGAVPLFAYVLHIYLVHTLSLIVLIATGRPIAGSFDAIRNAIFMPQLLEGTGQSLWVVYATWAVAIAILYPLCRWWGDLKVRRRDWWLSYL